MTDRERERIAHVWKRAGIVRNQLIDHKGKRITQALIDSQEGVVDMLAQILTDAHPNNQPRKEKS